MNWRMGRSELGRWRTPRWNLFPFKPEQAHIVPQGRNWTKTKRRKVVEETTGEKREGKRGGSVFFLLTLLLGSSGLHASSPSGRPGGRAGHRRPSSPSPFWSRWRSKQEGCGGARNDAVQRCLKDPLAATFCTTSEGRTAKPPPPSHSRPLRGGVDASAAPPSGRSLSPLDTGVVCESSAQTHSFPGSQPRNNAASRRSCQRPVVWERREHATQ